MQTKYTVRTHARIYQYQRGRPQKITTASPRNTATIDIETLGIFGSVSRGEDGPDSDIDILYKFSTELIRLRQFVGLKEYLEDLLGRNVDLVSINWMEPSIRPCIEQDMILLQTHSASV